MQDADALLRRASSLFRAGSYDEAARAYRDLLDVRPDLPDSWFNRAIAERRTRQFDDALASFARALTLGITGPEEVHLQRALIFSDDLGRSGDARAELEQALALDPDYVPALLNLGNLHEDLGDRDAACAAYARACAADPADALALARLIGASQPGADDPLLARARAAIADPRAHDEDRADLGFALGAALDRVGAYDAAFAAYREANRASRIMLAAQGVRYRPEAVEAFVARALESFPWPATDEDAAPVFICGMFRSGSTLAERILARHSGISAGGELDTLPALIGRAAIAYPGPAPSASLLAQMAVAYLAEAEPRRAPGTLLTDKRPDNFLHIGLIKSLFPKAKVVHSVRNRIDNILSVWYLHAGAAIPYATDLAEIAHYHDQQVRLMAHWKSLWPGDIHELDYDALVADPRPEIGKLLAFLGLDWEDAVLEPHRGAGAVQTASVWQVRQPLYRESSGRWRNYRAYLSNLLDGG
ncbi:sulfotransferase [Sphingomonas sp. AOB5]|uniref:tetratricopeptide repeat-containing sulfotransferase family protein n=1 Tax=Sphingomonas sp. AOB5 TaxID=3034017 RepID=UPI0023F809E6|nr:tetratricopeptide repeat-containing sulfotransferase family protein [Sphingomonas sp. AOB5]MDF7775089.1 sulfotransferase [Sphingomonas sp. AOB5]